MNCANERKRQYTDEEFQLFVDNFIEDIGGEREDLKLKLIETMARQKIKVGSFSKMKIICVMSNSTVKFIRC